MTGLIHLDDEDLLFGLDDVIDYLSQFGTVVMCEEAQGWLTTGPIQANTLAGDRPSRLRFELACGKWVFEYYGQYRKRRREFARFHHHAQAAVRYFKKHSEGVQ
jgi:hypothetical protein